MKIDSIMELIYSTEANSYYIFISGVKIVTDLNTYENIKTIFLINGVQPEMSTQPDGWGTIQYINK